MSVACLFDELLRKAASRSSSEATSLQMGNLVATNIGGDCNGADASLATSAFNPANLSPSCHDLDFENISTLHGLQHFLFCFLQSFLLPGYPVCKMWHGRLRFGFLESILERNQRGISGIQQLPWLTPTGLCGGVHAP